MAKNLFDEVVNTQSIVKSKILEDRKLLDDLAKEPAVNFTTSLPLSLRDKLKKKAVLEKVSVKDLIIIALLNKYEDLR